jgi:hypothetical protein
MWLGGWLLGLGLDDRLAALHFATESLKRERVFSLVV